MKVVRPILQALVLAERIYQDVSGKKIIAGTFNGMMIGKIAVPAEKQPDGRTRVMMPGGTDPGCPAIYISLTDVVNGTTLTLQFVNVSKNEVLFGTDIAIKEANRLATIEIIAALPPLAPFLNSPGTYSFDVAWEGEILGSHRVLVTEQAQS